MGKRSHKKVLLEIVEVESLMCYHPSNMELANRLAALKEEYRHCKPLAFDAKQRDMLFKAVAYYLEKEQFGMGDLDIQDWAKLLHKVE